MQVLTPADEIHHINKHNFKVPFVCGCRDLGEALRRIAEGAAMIRTKVGHARHDDSTRHDMRRSAAQRRAIRAASHRAAGHRLEHAGG